MVDISDMFRHVGRPNFMKPLSGPKFLKSKIFETDTETFFETKVFLTDTETFFRDQIFSRPIPRLFSRLNIFETDTETFFRDQIFSRPIPRLFFETKIFKTKTDTLKKLRKVSIPRSLETRCHTVFYFYFLVGLR